MKRNKFILLVLFIVLKSQLSYSQILIEYTHTINSSSIDLNNLNGDEIDLSYSLEVSNTAGLSCQDILSPLCVISLGMEIEYYLKDGNGKEFPLQIKGSTSSTLTSSTPEISSNSNYGEIYTEYESMNAVYGPPSANQVNISKTLLVPNCLPTGVSYVLIMKIDKGQYWMREHNISTEVFYNSSLEYSFMANSCLGPQPCSLGGVKTITIGSISVIGKNNFNPGDLSLTCPPMSIEGVPVTLEAEIYNPKNEKINYTWLNDNAQIVPGGTTKTYTPGNGSFVVGVFATNACGDVITESVKSCPSTPCSALCNNGTNDKDEDWLDVTTLDAPSNNTDDIFTLGRVGIGENNPGAILDIKHVPTFSEPAFKVASWPAPNVYPSPTSNVMKVDINNSMTQTLSPALYLNALGNFSIGSEANDEIKSLICNNGPLSSSQASFVSYKPSSFFSNPFNQEAGSTGLLLGNYNSIFKVGNDAMSDNTIAIAVNRGDCNSQGSDVFRVYGNGLVVTTGNNVIFSDKTLKENINPIDNPIGKINQLSGVTYNYINNTKLTMKLPNGTQTGLIADEVEAVIPDAVDLIKEGNYEYKVVNYTKVIPLLVESIKDQQESLEEKETKISSLENKLIDLENKINLLNDNLKLICEGDCKSIASGNDLNTKKAGVPNYLKNASLEQNFPNPSETGAIINFYIPDGTISAELKIIDVTGRVVKVVMLSTTSSSTIITPEMLAAGEYLYTLYLDNHKIDTKKMIVQ